ncbi:MAG TPA: hypothetical protein VFR78_12305 [Pyrinomonadaceae bacterium]|nr:hypothetical protein [Pyrinomonadaceae bacterium]
MKRRSEKRVEIHELLIIRTTTGSLPSLCEECSARDAIMLSPEQASSVTGVPERVIYQWVEAGAIHYREVRDGKLIVCVKTLLSMPPLHKNHVES